LALFSYIVGGSYDTSEKAIGMAPVGHILFLRKSDHRQYFGDESFTRQTMNVRGKAISYAVQSRETIELPMVAR